MIGCRKFKCEQCGSGYATASALKHHLDTSDHKFPCDRCLKVFHCERFLRRHLLTHNNTGQSVASINNTFTCHIITWMFKVKFVYVCSLARVCHVWQGLSNGGVPQAARHHSHEQDDLPMRRLLCNLSSKSSPQTPQTVARSCQKVQVSFQKVHRYVPPYFNVKVFAFLSIVLKCWSFCCCLGCDSAFNRADKLKAHIIAHSGVKPFKCKYCKKSFSRRAHLNEHESVHEGKFR